MAEEENKSVPVTGSVHLVNLQEIVDFLLIEIKPSLVIDQLPGDILNIGPKYIFQRDLEGVINWCLYHVGKKDIKEGDLPLNETSVSDVIKLNYSGMNEEEKKEKAHLLYLFLQKYLGRNIMINERNLEAIHDKSIHIQDKKHTFERLKLYSKIAIALKWLQSEKISEKLSFELKEHIKYLGDCYGKFKNKDLGKLMDYQQGKNPFEVSKSDLEILCYREKYITKDGDSYQEHFLKKTLKDIKEKLKIANSKTLEYKKLEFISGATEDLINFAKGLLHLDYSTVFRKETKIALSLILGQDPLNKKSTTFIRIINYCREEYIKYLTAKKRNIKGPY